MKTDAPVTGLVESDVQNFARKPGAWSGLPKANADWDSPETNADIAAELCGGELA